MPLRGQGEDSSGLYSFEEGLLPEIEALAASLEERARECEGLSAAFASLPGADAGPASAKPPVPGDPLTSLPSRQEILKRVKEEKNRADRTVEPGKIGFSLIVFDLDGLSAVNEAYGSKAGDKALKRFAGILKAAVRSYDLVGRFGSDEFLVLLPGADKEQAARVVKEAARKIAAWDGLSRETPLPGASGSPARLSCSAGLTDYRSEGKGADKGADAVVALAEYALHRARRKGPGSAMAWGGMKGASNGR